MQSASIGATSQRRMQSAANWGSILPSLVYPLMALAPVLRALKPRHVLWDGQTHAVQCVSGCEVKQSNVYVISFGGEFYVLLHLYAMRY